MQAEGMAESVTRLKGMVKDALIHEGVYGQLRAKLRASVLTCLNRKSLSEGPMFIATPRSKAVRQGALHQLVARLVREFMGFHDLDHAESVFSVEASLPEGPPARDAVFSDLPDPAQGRLREQEGLQSRSLLALIVSDWLVGLGAALDEEGGVEPADQVKVSAARSPPPPGRRGYSATSPRRERAPPQAAVPTLQVDDGAPQSPTINAGAPEPALSPAVSPTAGPSAARQRPPAFETPSAQSPSRETPPKPGQMSGSPQGSPRAEEVSDQYSDFEEEDVAETGSPVESTTQRTAPVEAAAPASPEKPAGRAEDGGGDQTPDSGKMGSESEEVIIEDSVGVLNPDEIEEDYSSGSPQALAAPMGGASAATKPPPAPAQAPAPAKAAAPADVFGSPGTTSLDAGTGPPPMGGLGVLPPSRQEKAKAASPPSDDESDDGQQIGGGYDESDKDTFTDYQGSDEDDEVNVQGEGQLGDDSDDSDGF
eukprot:Hpha_TRINITY_DN8558_c0_g1::TRINITY_DN8558_c0_g1_i1::g.146618::m.146618